MTELTVVIPHLNDHARLERCLAALCSQDLTGTHIVVADNGSNPPLDDLTMRFPQIEVVIEPKPGAAEARNRGALRAQSEGLAFLDADCVPDKNWVAQARLSVRPNAVVGGDVLLFDETPPPRSGAEAFDTVFGFSQRYDITHRGYSVTASLVTTRTVFARTGPFVAGLSEDLDWCRRATAHGVELHFAPDMKVAHPTRSTWPALRRKWHRLTEEGFATDAQGLQGRLLWMIKALLMPLSIPAHVPRIWRHSALGTTDKLRGIAVLARLRLLRMLWMLRQAFTGQAQLPKA